MRPGVCVWDGGVLLCSGQGVCVYPPKTRSAAGRQGTLTVFLVGAEIPTPFRKGALESLEGEFESPRNRLRLEKMGAEVPLRVNTACRYVLGAVSFDAKGGTQYGRGATQSAPRLSKDNELLLKQRADGGFLPGLREQSV